MDMAVLVFTTLFQDREFGLIAIIGVLALAAITVAGMSVYGMTQAFKYKAKK